MSRKLPILLLILAIPIGVALFLKFFGKNKYELDVFYPDGVISTNTFCEFEPGQHYIPDFNLINQDSLVVSGKILNDKISVVNFFFSSCPTICPVMSSEMMRVQEVFQENPDIQILGFSVDPEYDTPEVLRSFGDRFDVKSGFWHLLTGPRDEIYQLARCGFILPVEHGGDDPYDFIHSEKFILVDGQRRIRGYYDGTSRKDVDRLIIEIQILMRE
jgi:protein SCO1/2